ncbi:MAG: glycoside hydrolase family 99-like domain-containing protein [Opitutaceae bacterium]|jgi:hypothetical protein|nr:glycoside hydrolase family 99-like domain-containing protein [Opitutaceae bacterium]
MNRAELAAYYFPNYHLDARNKALHGPGWTEWELLKRAEPRFAGHYQPRVPQWGYQDEADPAVMAQKIAAAADHGLDAFIFDWYWYDDGAFLQRALDEGFLRAKNNHRLKFALMWANHDWIDLHPAKIPPLSGSFPALLYPGRVTWQTWTRIIDHCIGRYFSHPSYWHVGGCPYFSIYEPGKLLESFGGIKGARRALDYFRERAVEAGFPGVHLNAIVWNSPILPGESRPLDPARLVAQPGFDSVTSYVWIHHAEMEKFPEASYDRAFERYCDYWRHADQTLPVPYFPNVTVGWDSSPRTVQSDLYQNRGYPFGSILAGNTPERFGRALRETRERLLASDAPLKIITLNAWNEWTEGSYLEPDERHGLAYLQAIKNTVSLSRPQPVPALSTV